MRCKDGDGRLLAQALDEAVAKAWAERTLSSVQIAEVWFRQPPEARARIATLAGEAMERRRRAAKGRGAG